MTGGHQRCLSPWNHTCWLGLCRSWCDKCNTVKTDLRNHYVFNHRSFQMAWERYKMKYKILFSWMVVWLNKAKISKAKTWRTLSSWNPQLRIICFIYQTLFSESLSCGKNHLSACLQAVSQKHCLCGVQVPLKWKRRWKYKK